MMERERPVIARQAQNNQNYFMQNCDLPPPLKVFTGLDKAIALSVNRCDGELLKALRLSQTRAREAEKAAAGLIEEKERTVNAFMKDSFHLFAYRQWVRLLEFQVSKLQSQLVKKEELDSDRCSCEQHDDQKRLPEGNEDDVAWVVALPLCLGIAICGICIWL